YCTANIKAAFAVFEFDRIHQKTNARSRKIWDF
ncbi:unnamed protein product, partial [marine sediment metagenome]